MSEMKQIYDFAVKWFDKFSDKTIDYLELVNHHMADDCAALGFEMDCGYAFSQKYGSAARDYEALDRIIDDIDDIPLLGSAIYSRWRYFNHWAYTGAEILEENNRVWFMLALNRLAILSGGSSFMFQGTLKKMRIISNNICYGPQPEPGDEVEQHITIDAEGRVWFSGYNFGYTCGEYEKARICNFTIAKESAEKLMIAISGFFSNEYIKIYETDVGYWMLELTNTDGVTYKFRGSLYAHIDWNGTDLSDLVRDTLGMDDLYVFDGNYKPDVINRITLEYHRITKIKSKVESEDAAKQFVTWDYNEKLVIDRETESLEYIHIIGTGCKVSCKYEIEGGIESLLDKFDARDLFVNIKGNPDDVMETPNESKDYSITIDYEKNPQCIITGTFDKHGLPDDFEKFADTVFKFIHFYDWEEILDPSIYGKVKRRKTDYIFCSVTFNEGQKSYYYLTEDESIEIGDFVVVPVGNGNHEVVVEVVNIEYFDEDNAPFPIEKTKQIIRKYVEAEEDTHTENIYQ